MKLTAPHLADEHMTFYEWNGNTPRFGVARNASRGHRWQASASVLAVLATLLILTGCDRQSPVEANSEKTAPAGEDTREQAADLYDEIKPQPPGPAEQAGAALDDARDAAGEKVEAAGDAPKR